MPNHNKTATIEDKRAKAMAMQADGALALVKANAQHFRNHRGYMSLKSVQAALSLANEFNQRMQAICDGAGDESPSGTEDSE